MFILKCQKVLICIEIKDVVRISFSNPDPIRILGFDDQKIETNL
jgi:hypothetical protein